MSHPMQQFAYTTGKNSTDSALIIDAMDLLHSGTVDGFCLVSSDSDFTRLAARIREQGLLAYGFGERKTPEPFRRACTTFIYVENLGDEDTPQEKKPAPAEVGKDRELGKLLAEAVSASMGDDGWANLGAVGSNLVRLTTDFDTRSWGFSKLKDLMEAHLGYEMSTRERGDGRQSSTYVRPMRKNG